MEIEREFKKVDNALSAAALSAVIIHKQECSHDDIVTLESLVPGFVFENRAVKGFTNEASLENFGKIKDAVSNAITTAIKKIRELITRFIDWIKGKGTKTQKDAKKVSDDLNEIHKEGEKKQDEAVKVYEEQVAKAEENVKKDPTPAAKEFLDQLKQKREYGADLKKWANDPSNRAISLKNTQALSRGVGLLTLLIGDNVKYSEALAILVQYKSPSLRKNIFYGDLRATGYLQRKAIDKALGFLKEVGDREINSDTSRTWEKYFNYDDDEAYDKDFILQGIVAATGKDPEKLPRDFNERKVIAEKAMEWLFSDVPENKPARYTDIEDIRELVAQVSIDMPELSDNIYAIDKGLLELEKLNTKQLTDFSREKKDAYIYKRILRNIIDDMNIGLKYLMKVKLAQNALLLEVGRVCDSLRKDEFVFD